MKLRQHRNSNRRRGAALVIATMLAITIAGLALALLTTNLSTERVRVEDRGSQRAFYAAEAGLNDAYVQMSNGLIDLTAGPPYFVGKADDPIKLDKTSYFVEIEPFGANGYTLASSGIDNDTVERLELRLDLAPSGFFQYAAFGAEGVNLQSNAFIDSYNSSSGTYASQVQSGNDFALENGEVGSNKDIAMNSNSEIHGDATPGPGGILYDSAPGTLVTGSTDPAEEEFPMPPIDVPPIPSTGTLSGTSDVTLGPGDVHIDSLLMSGGTTLTIVGPATVIIDEYNMKSGAEIVFDASAGGIDLYGTGDFVLESNTTMTTPSQSAVDVTIFLSGDNMSPGSDDNIKLSSNADFNGAIYAPNIEYSLNSNFNVFGSIICGKLDLSSNGEIHFDEALLYAGDGDGTDYDVTLWRELPLE